MMAAAWTSGRNVPLARQLARSALAVTLGDLPPDAIAKAKDCLLDFLACAFEARNLPWSRQAVATARAVEGGANVIAGGATASPADAAFANATLGHGLVREDMHAASICHHGVGDLADVAGAGPAHTRVRGRRCWWLPWSATKPAAALAGRC
jgi:2-methylcitrate dehydratase PrpD